MKDNKYDEPDFFEAYGKMLRSRKGLEGAGEWHSLKQLLTDFKGKRVLDLGCGYGWHCRYAVENGAVSVVGIDLRENACTESRPAGRVSTAHDADHISDKKVENTYLFLW